jgi:hypothetical protein
LSSKLSQNEEKTDKDKLPLTSFMTEQVVIEVQQSKPSEKDSLQMLTLVVIEVQQSKPSEKDSL